MKKTWAVAALMLAAVALTCCSNKKANSATRPAPKAAEPLAVLARDSAIRPTEAATLAHKNDSTRAASPESKKDGVFMGMWGSVGGTGFLFDMDGLTGSYIPYDIAEAKSYGERRQLKLVSYNEQDGHCVIDAYLKGAYIGRFDGTFKEYEEETDGGGSFYFASYEGTFTSKKGARLDFHFHFD